MPLYFFDFDDGALSRDDIGTEYPDDEAMRQGAMRALPEIAKHEIPDDSDAHALTVRVRDEADRPVYTATLTYQGTWIRDRPGEGRGVRLSATSTG